MTEAAGQSSEFSLTVDAAGTPVLYGPPVVPALRAALIDWAAARTGTFHVRVRLDGSRPEAGERPVTSVILEPGLNAADRASYWLRFAGAT